MIDFITQGIQFRIHLLFWGVIGLSLAAGYFIETLSLFIIVLIHELGHIAVAKELGWKVTEVQLLPFGGVATVEEEVSDPLDDIVIALAGPFMNVMMIALSVLLHGMGFWSAEWTTFFIDSNVMIALFNLLPIWPLDGGRILQALLCYGLPYRRAAITSLLLSSLLAATMLGVGIYLIHLNLMAIALYLLFINAQAYIRFPFQFIRFLLKKYVHTQDTPDVSKMRSITISPSTTLMEACWHIRKGSYHLFCIRGQTGCGEMLPEEAILHALLFERKHDISVANLL